MASKFGEVKKIYRLEAIGYDSLHKQLSTLSEDLVKIKKNILDLQGKKIGLSGDDLAKVNQQIVEQGTALDDVKKKMVGVNTENETSINNYFQLNKAYQLAKKNAQDLAAAHGIESKEAIEAAATAAAYKQQLVEINNLVKTGGRPLAPVVPITPIVSTTNIGSLNEADIAKTGDALSDLERQEAEVANAAAAMGQANLQAAEEIKIAGSAASAIRTKYEEFTGTIRQNITAHIENNQQLLANRASQKEIQSAITAQGSATDAQIGKLAALREEELILAETNKALTITIRNQTKEFIADAGSLDQMQAQVNQLQQAYEQLTETEKASPFGQRMKAEIDVLEPKVKSLEFELGKTGRNVGNYPQIFGGAFKVLGKELDTIQGKLVSGNFTGNALANLTAQEQVLTNATKVLGQQFATTSQQQAAFKEQARILAITFGTDSTVFKNFTSQIAIANTELKKTDQQLVTTGKTGSGVFAGLYGGLRKLANIIPGFGISGLVLLLLAPLESLATSLGNVSKKALQAQNAVSDLAERQKILKEITDEAIKGYAEETTRIDILKKIITDHTLSIDKRRTAVDEYNKIADEGNKIDKQAIDNTAVIEAAINRQILLIQKRALARAAENVIAKKAEELFLKQFELEDRFPAASEARIKELKDKAQAVIDEASKKLKVKPATANEVLSFVDLPNEVIAKGQKSNAGLKVLLDERTKVLLTSFNTQLKLIDSNRKNLTGGNSGLQVLVDDIGQLNTELERVTKVGIGFISDVGGQLEKPARTKDNAILNELKDIETARLHAIAIENTRTNEIQKIRTLSFDEEIFHLRELERINVEALNKKIAVFNRKKKLTSDEKKDRAEFGEQITAIELDTSKKINDIEKKRFDTNVKGLQTKLDNEITRIQLAKTAIIDNIESTELEKAKAQLDADNKELDARKRFFVSLLFLNDQFNKEALIKAKEAIDKQQQETNKDRQKITGATLQDIKIAGDKEIQGQDIKFELLRNKILNNDKLTADKRKKQLEILGKAHERTILAIELKTLQAQFELTKSLFAFGLISEKAFLDAQEKFIKKANELKNQLLGTKGDEDKLRERFGNLKDAIQSGLRSAFKIDKGSLADEALGEVISQSYDLALTAMNDFFDAERQNIEQSLKLNLERLDMEEQQVKARATSAAEIASIEKQYAAKKRTEELKAHEELKKSKRSEAKIAFAIEVANIWSQAQTFPFPVNLIVGGLLTGLAAARLSLNLNRINRESFAQGGIAAPTKNGGEIQGPSHAQGGVPFKYEAQGKELMIINKTSAQDNKVRTITGTNKQIASMINELGGGVSFSKGAKSHSFESGGYLGTNLTAPVFVPASNNSISQSVNNNNDQMNELIAVVKDHQRSTDERIDRIQVNLVTNKVTEAQKKQKQYSDVGTL